MPLEVLHDYYTYKEIVKHINSGVAELCLESYAIPPRAY
jgi:hypothetical protein